MSAEAPSHFLPFYPSPGPKLWDGNSATFTHGFSSSIQPLWKRPHRHNQVSQVIANVEIQPTQPSTSVSQIQATHSPTASQTSLSSCERWEIACLHQHRLWFQGQECKELPCTDEPCLAFPTYPYPAFFTRGRGRRSGHLKAYLRIWGGACTYQKKRNPKIVCTNSSKNLRNHI